MNKPPIMVNYVSIILCFILVSSVVDCRIHKLRIDADLRASFPITSFGFRRGGTLAVNLVNFYLDPANSDDSTKGKRAFGFSLHKSEAFNPYLEHETNGIDFLARNQECYLERTDFSTTGNDDGMIFFVLDESKSKLIVTCSDNMDHLDIEAAVASKEEPTVIVRANESMKLPTPSPKSNASETLSTTGPIDQSKVSGAKVQPSEGMRRRRDPSPGPSSKSGCRDVDIPLVKTSLENSRVGHNASFFITISSKENEGLYSLFYHNCYNTYEGDLSTTSNFAIYVVEKNGDSFLSAGEMPLPSVYLAMATLFFISALFWTIVLKRNGTEFVYRIHWIMAALIYLKSLSLLFHGINYHKIETYGYHIESWAVLYYVTHLLKGALLFFTIVLIGSGWAFIKHILTDREKRVFMIILPLQVLANVAYIIIEESEEGEIRHSRWKEIFILVDLICCGAILFPVVWSIRHLQEASQTDGKATISLEKLKLFRHFYIMVVVYIYFTRIIVYLLKITAPYKYEWLDDVFNEAATFIFFSMTGYKFRPASNNPYFALRTDDYEMEEEVLVSSTAIDEEVVKRKKSNKKFATGGDSDDSEDSETAVFFADKNESSHELD